MVLRVANARALIIDLRRHYYLQLGLWLYPMNYTQKPHRDPGLLSLYLQFSVHICHGFESHRLVKAAPKFSPN